MTQWKCDKCGADFNLDDIPDECPECKANDGSFSLME